MRISLEEKLPVKNQKILQGREALEHLTRFKVPLS